MSIYSTLWEIRLPVEPERMLIDANLRGWTWKDGEQVPYTENWVEVFAQGVPGHIGHPDERPGRGDDCAAFLPPALTGPYREDGLRAVVILLAGQDEKGTPRHAQEYVRPLIVLSGEEYEKMRFAHLLEWIEQEVYARLKPR